MYIGSDISLKGDIWNDVLDKLKPIIDTNYGVFILAASIGIYYDRSLESLPANLSAEQYRSIPRSILHNNAHILDLFFKSAIITTNTIELSEDSRMELAFNDDSKAEDAKNFNRMGFIAKFANYGVQILAEKIGEDTLENIEELNNFITLCATGLALDEIDLTDLDITEGDIE